MRLIEYLKEKLFNVVGMALSSYIIGGVLLIAGEHVKSHILIGLGNILIAFGISLVVLDIVDYLIEDYRRWKREKQKSD